MHRPTYPFVFACALAFVGSAKADPITITDTFLASSVSGSLNGTNTIVTITLSGDSSDITTGSGYSTFTPGIKAPGVKSITVNGVTQDFSNTMGFEFNMTNNLIQLYDEAEPDSLIVQSNIAPAVGSMSSPAIYTAGAIQTYGIGSTSHQLDGTAGAAFFNIETGQVYITASSNSSGGTIALAVPEPTSALMAVLGLATVAGVARRRLA